MLQRIQESKLRQKDSGLEEDDQGMCALILVPTRELALQVHKNLQDVAKALSMKVYLRVLDILTAHDML